MVTSCRWQRTKVVAADGEASKVVYLFSQGGQQELVMAGKTMTTTFTTQASRLEFVSIQEALLAQRPPQEEELAALFLRCEEELLTGSLALKPPFHADNIKGSKLLVVPFIIFYFALRHEQNAPLAAIPVSLFNGLVAPKLLPIMRQFPLATTGVSTIISPNFSLEEAFYAASELLEDALNNATTGRSSLLWCDTTEIREEHRRSYSLKSSDFDSSQRRWEQEQHQVLGLQPVEYINPALILVPHLSMNLREAVQGSNCGLLDPILQNVYLLPHELDIREI